MIWYLLGAGSMGSLAAFYLQQAGMNVAALSHSIPPAKLDRELGFLPGTVTRARHQLGDSWQHLRLPCAAPERIDVLLLATKAGQTRAALTPWLSRLSDNATLICLQNGMGQLDDLALPTRARLIHAITTNAAFRDGERITVVAENSTFMGDAHPRPLSQRERGANVHLLSEDRAGVRRDWPHYRITSSPLGGESRGEESHPHGGSTPSPLGGEGWGEGKDGTQVEDVPDWFAELASAWPQLTWCQDIRQRQLAKLAVNALINPLTAIHHVTNGELLSPRLYPTLAALAAEVDAILLALDASWPGDALARAEQVARLTAGNTSSMLADVQAGRPTEIAFINGYLVREAARLGLDAPLNHALLTQLG